MSVKSLVAAISAVAIAAIAHDALAAAPASAGTPQAGVFAECPDARQFAELAGSLCALVEADGAAEPSLDRPPVKLFVRKFPAIGSSRGAVWIIAGGPGESGASFYPLLGTLRRGFPNLDLIIPDHRGTGYSTRLCPAEESVDSPGGTALSGAEWGTCFGGLANASGHAAEFSITNAAHDLRQLILRFHDGGPTYVYGVSYGTQLVLRMLQLGEISLNGVILDSLVPLQTDAAGGFEPALAGR